MANKTINQLPAAGVLSGTETFPIEQGGTTKYATITQIAAALQAGLLPDVPEWQPNTAYASGELVLNAAGQIVQANATFTSGATYTPSNWTVLSLTLATVQALIAAQAASDAATYLPLPAGTKTAGYVPVAQADGTTAWGAQSGGGGGAAIDDTTTSTSKVWSSSKTSSALAGKQATSLLVIGATTGTDDTAQFNAALSAAASFGLRVKGTAGQAYTLQSTPVIYSGTELDMTGCTITGPAGSQYLKNASTVPSRTVTDAVTTAGSTTVTSATANFTSADVGMAIGVLGAGPNAGRADAPGTLYGTVISVTDSQNVVLSQAATTSNTGKTLAVYPARDSNITVIGGTWNGGARTAQSLLGHGLFFRRVDGLRISGLTLTSTGSPSGGSRYAINYGDCTDVEIGRIQLNTVSDGIHGQGPLSHVSVHHIYGTTGDDMVAFTGVDGQSTTGSLLGDVEGDMIDISVTDVFSLASLRALKLTSGTGTNGVPRIIKGFHAARLMGTVQLDAVSVTDYAGVTTFDGTISDVTARPSGSGFYPRVKLDASGAGTVLLRNMRWEDTGHCPTGGIVAVTQPIQSLTIDGLTMKGTVAGNGVGVLVSAAVGNLALNGLRVPDSTPTFYGIQYGTTATQAQGRIAVRDVYKLGGGDVINVTSAVTSFSYTEITGTDGYQAAGTFFNQSADGTAAGKIKISDWHTGGYLLSLRAPTTVHVNALEQAGAGAAIRAASAAASPVRILAGQVSLSGSGAALASRTATQSISMDGLGASADITTLTPLEGDIVTNTNASASTGVGRSIYSGTAWDNLETDATGGTGGGGGLSSIPAYVFPHTLAGMKSWAFDPGIGISSGSIASNVGIYVPQYTDGGTITNVQVNVSAVATGITDARGVVYDANGTLLGVTNNMSSDTATTGFKTWALQTPITGLAVGQKIIVALWVTGGSLTTIKSNSNSPVPGVMYVGTPRQLQQSNSAYQTSITPGSMGASSTLWWIGTS